MLVVTQGLGTRQLPIHGFGDNITHTDAPVTAHIQLEARPSVSFSTDGLPSFTFTQDGITPLTLTMDGVPSVGTATPGGYTEVGTDGIWFEDVGQAMGHPMSPGAYTKDNIFDLEIKPQVWPSLETTED